MEEGLLRDALLAILGLVTGGLSGAFGVGGAVVSQPGIRALGVPALVAVGTTLPSILPSAVSGTLRYRKAGVVDWGAVLLAVPGGLVGSRIGALLSDDVPGDGHVLMLGTAALLGVTAYRMSRAPGAPAVGEHPARRTAPRSREGLSVIAIGTGAGLLSGLLGIGGGVVMVPAFTALARMPLRTAIATSLVCVGAFAVPGTITHARLDHIDWRVALLLSAFVIPGARIGASLALKVSETRLRRQVAIFLGVIAVIYAVGETAALLG